MKKSKKKLATKKTKSSSSKKMSPGHANSKAVVAKKSAERVVSAKPKIARPKTKVQKDLAPVEVVPMMQSPKAAEVESSQVFDSTGGLLKKINGRFNPRSQFRHQSR